jgi:sulfate transport system permease protein
METVFRPPKAHPTTRDPALLRYLLLTIVLVFTAIFLLLPLCSVFFQALQQGMPGYIATLQKPTSQSAIWLTLMVAAFAVPCNLLFGVCAAWAIAKFEFPGKSFLITLIDIPFAVSPVIAGMIFVLLFGKTGWFDPLIQALHLKIIFAPPGLVLATIFVTFPFVARALIPLMQTQGSEEEQAALSLGANGWQTFWRITLPKARWGLLYGIILCNARAMGEFGAVSVVSGHIVGGTNTIPLQVQMLYESNNFAGAFAIASLLTLLAVLTLLIKSFLEWRMQATTNFTLTEAPSFR